MPQPGTDRIVVTEEARKVAAEIRTWGYKWANHSDESFGERIDAVRGTPYGNELLAGSSQILEIFDHVPKADYGHGVWKELGLDPDQRGEAAECCKGMIRALR